MSAELVDCPNCDGSGEVHSHNSTCWACCGSGKLTPDAAEGARKALESIAMTTPEQPACECDRLRANYAELLLELEHCPTCAKTAADLDTLRAETARLRAELEQARDSRRWLPIESAPKDGKYFLVGWFVDENPDPERWVTVVALRGQVLNDYLLSVPGKYNIGTQATHWQPLPPPPAIDAAGRREGAK